MAFKARVYLQRPGELQAKYIGETDVTPRPVRNGRTVFTHAGKTETGRVDTVEPPDWDKTGAVPTIHVTLSQGE
jgi:hypothetical protein